MILALFGVLMAIGLILIILGLVIREHTELALIGFLFIFLLSFELINGTLEYQTGIENVYKYGNNFTGYHWDYDYSTLPNTNNDIYLFHVTEYNQYTFYQNRTMGIYLAIISIIGMIVLAYNLKINTKSIEMA